VRAPLALLREASENLHLPVAAIGGITPENGAALIAAGASLLAVISGVFGAEDPREAAQRYSALFNKGLK
jgi:thiamine-phosphate pyrophosphorylase